MVGFVEEVIGHEADPGCPADEEGDEHEDEGDGDAALAHEDLVRSHVGTGAQPATVSQYLSASTKQGHEG